MEKEIIYFIQPCELLETDRYKIGCSVKQGMERISTGYKKGTRILHVVECKNPFELEGIIKKEFSKKFHLIAGNEFFKGDENLMLIEFKKIINDYNINLNKQSIKDQILNNELNEFEKKIISDEKQFKKHINLIVLLHNINNLQELKKMDYLKINLCKGLMNVLNINKIEELNKDIINRFDTTINTEWLNNNIDNIKKTFDIRTNKYDDFNYYNLYLLLITILKNLFDVNLFVINRIKRNKNRSYCYIINNECLNNHKITINKINFNNIC